MTGRNGERTGAKRTWSYFKRDERVWNPSRAADSFLEDVSKAEESKFRDFSLRLLNFHSTSEIR